MLYLLTFLHVLCFITFHTYFEYNTWYTRTVHNIFHLDGNTVLLNKIVVKYLKQAKQFMLRAGSICIIGDH